MAAWYKEPDYNGGGVTRNKAFEPDIKKAIPALAMAAAPVAAELAKPIAQNLGQRASKHIDEKGVTIPIVGPFGPKIGGDKKMLKEESVDNLIRQQNMAAKAGRTELASHLAQKIANLRRQEFNTPKVRNEIATNKVWREGGQQNKFGHGQDYMKSVIKSIDSFLMRKGIIQKTANKSSLPLGDYQKAGKPIKRMVNSRAVDVSPDVWSAGKKTTITKI